ncbi:protein DETOXIFICATION 27 [Quercus suber]|uniref:protein DETOXIFICATION 27 n=1 Tax=Quercus suber TaxID=58331 RepID=UPI000CE1E38D|nr:protein DETOXIFICATION 27-like [Quercus suber]POE85957.1 protein detoxification 27 [Quercus suber]
MGSITDGDNHHEDLNQSLLPESSIKDEDHIFRDLASRVWIESKKLWHIVGPAIFSRVASYSMNVITQAFAGHLGEVELASTSIAINVILGFCFGLMLGMASALETLCGQAFGAKRYPMLGIYLQRSWIVLFLCCVLLSPFYVFAGPILKLIGLSNEVAEQTGLVARWLIPLHFSFAFYFPVQRFLQSQLKTLVIAWTALVALLLNVLISWLFVIVWDFGLVGAIVALDISWWTLGVGLYLYVVCGGCPLTWTGLSVQAFSGLWEFLKLSAGSGVMLCLEFWYYKILTLMTGYLKDATIAVDALSICMNIIGWEMMIHLAFLAGAGVRVANELGAGNGKAAQFASIVSVAYSTMIGLLFCILILIFHEEFANIFTSNTEVVQEVDKLLYLLGATILLNSVQPVLSGVAIGSGWQALVAYVNLGCYYIIGLPLGIIMGWVFNLGLMGIWAGMIIGGTVIQTVILAIITIRCDWENEAVKANIRVCKWSNPKPDDQSEVLH